MKISKWFLLPSSRHYSPFRQGSLGAQGSLSLAWYPPGSHVAGVGGEGEMGDGNAMLVVDTYG